MRILVDTHFLIWSFTDPELISPKVTGLFLSDENEVYYSQASLWEISIKYNSGKLILTGMTPEELLEEIDSSYFECLKLENETLASLYHLPTEHRAPFDRLMIWQSIKSDLYFLSVDSEIPKYEKFGLKILRNE